MCRLPDCNRPVRISKTSSSKYCSDEHGKKFMRRKVAPGDRSNSEEDDKFPPKRKKKKTSRNGVLGHVAQANFTPSINNNNEDEIDRNGSDDDGHDSDYDQSHLRGGLLRPSELKALTNSVSSLSDFRRLGSPVFANEGSASTGTNQVNASSAITQTLPPIPHTPAEQSQLEHLTAQRAALKRRRALLDGKEKFLGLVKGRAKLVLEDLKAKDKSLKDICGYDTRLSWADEEFEAWKDSPEGIATLGCGTLERLKTAEDNDMKMDDAQRDDDAKPPSGRITGSEPKLEEAQTECMCVKKRCERHRQWFKISTQEIAFEKDTCRVEMRRVAKEEKAVLERAQVRWLENGGVGEQDEEKQKAIRVDGDNEGAIA